MYHRIVLVVTLLVAIGTPATGQELPSGKEVVTSARALKSPLGVEAPRIFNEIKDRTFTRNVRFSNEWILNQVIAYEKVGATYKKSVAEMMEDGGIEGGLGMRSWLIDPDNEAFWNPTIRRLVGEKGYARVIALNGAFPPGSDDFQLTYGGVRRYDSKTNSLELNGVKFQDLDRKALLVVFPPKSPLDKKFEILVKYGDAIREQMFRFYEAFLAGKISEKQVSTFNEAYTLAGGCAVAATAPKSEIKAERYLYALNLMAKTLGDLGFKVEF